MTPPGERRSPDRHHSHDPHAAAAPEAKTGPDPAAPARPIPRRLDAHTYAICLEVPATKIVLLQGIFENYEGIGTVRTLDIERSLVCILTTPSMVQDCIDVLHAIEYTVPWRAVECPAETAPI